MLGELTEFEIEDMLKQQVTGRIGCHADDITYIVPINYVYKDGYVYGHSGPGKKIEMLRKNPKVCFQIDQVDSIVNWKSVVSWGEYQQITRADEMVAAMQLIIKQLTPMMREQGGHPSHGITTNESDIGTAFDLILYKIRLDKKTGRFEKPE